jgi:hypothetical protein
MGQNSCFKKPVIKSNVYVSLGCKGVVFNFNKEYEIDEIDFTENGEIFGQYRDLSHSKRKIVEVDKSFAGYKFRFKTNLLYYFHIKTNEGTLWGYFVIFDVSEPKKIMEINFNQKSKDLKIFNCGMWEELNQTM